MKQFRKANWPPGCPDENYAAKPQLLKAQQKILNAWKIEETQHTERVKIAMEALTISELCADAWYCLAEHEASTIGL